MNDKPSRPIIAIPLILVAFSGLVAQFLAARGAFDIIAVSPWHAGAAALLIEAATVVEALEFVKSRNHWAGSGLIITMLVSGIYNYTQAESVNSGLGLIPLVAMSVGPLVALTSIGLTLGAVMRRYEVELAEWQLGQAEIAEHNARLTRSEQIKLDRKEQDDERWRQETDRKKLDIELSLLQTRQKFELNETRLATRRAEKREKDALSYGLVNAAPGPVQGPALPVLDRARAVLETEPDISGSELGRRLGTSVGWGRKLKRKISDNGKENS